MSADASERETLRQRFAYWGLATVEWLARTLPTRTGRRVFSLAGSVAYALSTASRRTVAANQARVLGRPPEDPLVVASTKQAFRLYARYWFDAFHVLAWSDRRIEDAFVFEGYEHVDAALEAGHGVIVALPHLGNWDAVGRVMLARGRPPVAVAERLEPRRVYELFVTQREELGMTIVPLSSDGGVGRRLSSALAENRIVALVADRALSGRGVRVDMFGATRTMPAGPAMLAITTGAPLLPVAVYQTPEGWRCVVQPPLPVPSTGSRKSDVAELTRSLAAAFERAIAAAPSDWHMFQPAWED